MRLILAVAAILSLAGCVTAQEQIALDDQKCLSYGTPKGSDAYVTCRLELERHHTADRITNSMSPGSFILNNIQQH